MRNTRDTVVGWLIQLAVLALIVSLAAQLSLNAYDALALRGLLPSFHFLFETAGFDIGEVFLPYSRSSSYLLAFACGILNTLYVSLVASILATFLGLGIALMRISPNILSRAMGSTYVHFFRNIPLLLLLIFWKGAVFNLLPSLEEAHVLPGSILLSNRGLAMPFFDANLGLWEWLIATEIAFLVAAPFVIFLPFFKQRRRTSLLLLFVLSATTLFFAVPERPTLGISYPEVGTYNTTGGLAFSPEFLALTSGLILFEAAFMAEVIRSGLLAVPKGQKEASLALGLTNLQTIRLVTLPQAMRLITPPMISQYLNLIKNTSLAVYIGYPDLFAVAGTIFNQTGRSVEVILLVMSTYLFFSLSTSWILNIYNERTRWGRPK